jgi:hypothetical protein
MPHRFRKRPGKEIIILEHPQESKIDRYAQPKPEQSPAALFVLRYFYPRKKIQQGREHQKEKEPPVPAGIKKITRRQQKSVLKGKVLIGNEPIDKKHGRKEKGVT